MTDDELTAVIRRGVHDLESPSGAVMLKDVARRFKEAGCERNIHVGHADFADGIASRRMTLEWYAGQLVDMAESGALFGVNSWLNCVDKFAPETEGREVPR